MDEIRFEDIFSKEITLLDAESFRNKGDLFDTMAGLLYEAGCIDDRDSYLESLYFRESEGPTYMGEGIAMPHGKCAAVKRPAVCFVRTKEPFTYRTNTENGEAQLILMLAIPGSDETNLHIRMLATLARKLVYPEVVEGLKKAANFEEVIATLNME